MFRHFGSPRRLLRQLFSFSESRQEGPRVSTARVMTGTVVQGRRLDPTRPEDRDPKYLPKVLTKVVS